MFELHSARSLIVSHFQICLGNNYVCVCVFECAE